MTDNQRVAAATRDWVEKVVIGYNFCPFAKPVFTPDLIRYEVDDSGNPADILETVYQACQTLRESPEIATTLVIFYRCGNDFDDYLDILGMAERLLDASGFSGEFQLASFHPDYLFEGEDPDDASHYTNRSPWPVLHIIREKDIEEAMKNKDESSAIYERNMRKAASLGSQHLAQLLASLRQGQG